MSEQIFLNGAPVVGFGDYYSTSEEQAREKRDIVFMSIPFLGIIAGAGGGGVLGYKYGKGWGAVGGALAGGVAGGIVGVATSVGVAKATTPTTGVGTPPVAAAAGLPWGEFVASGVVTSLVGLAVEEAVRAVRGR